MAGFLWCTWFFRAAVIVPFVMSAPAAAQEYDEEPPEATGKFEGLIDEPIKLEVTLRGSRVVFDARMIRPVGRGPFPLALLMHGGITDYPRRAAYRTESRSMLGHQLARRGWVALTFLRLGYGATGGEPIEFTGRGNRCDFMSHEQGIMTVAEQAVAAIEAARRLPYIDSARIIATGQSYGGAGVMALSALPVEGLRAVVNFAGGSGSNEKGELCNPSDLYRAWGRFGSASRVPSLSIHAENDKWVRPDVARALFNSYSGGSSGKAEILFTPPSGTDGHGLSGRREHVHYWAPKLDEFLRKHNLPTWPVAAITPQTIGIAASTRNRESLARYLAAGTEKAIATSTSGAWGFRTEQTSTEEAKRQALANCQKASPNVPCRIVAVNFEIMPK